MDPEKRELAINHFIDAVAFSCKTLLELTSYGLHDRLNVTEWDAVRLLAERAPELPRPVR